MAYVCLDNEDKVVCVFNSPQAEPAPEGYAVIADDDARLTTFYAAPLR